MESSADRLRKLRIAHGFSTAYEAADRFGWNKNTYSSNENGNAVFGKNAAKRYAAAYGVSWAWLLDGDASGSQPSDYNTASIKSLESRKKLTVTVLFSETTPGGEVTVQREIDLGDLPENVAYFVLDVAPGQVGPGLPGGTVIGAFFDDIKPVAGNVVAVEIEAADGPKRYALARLEVGADDTNTLHAMDGSGRLQVAPGEHERVVGKIVEYRLRLPPVEGRTAKHATNKAVTTADQ